MYLLATIVLVAATAVVYYSPVFALRTSTVSGPYSELAAELLNRFADTGTSLFRQPVSKLADTAASLNAIRRIDISYKLPGTLTARTNVFDPVALVISSDNRLFGLDAHGRLLPPDSAWNIGTMPIVNGFSLPDLFEEPDDFRLGAMLKQLVKLRDEHNDLYAHIAEIDFSDSVYIHIYLITSNCTFMVTGDDLERQLRKLAEIAKLPEWSDAAVYDLHYDDVVIRRN